MYGCHAVRCQDREYAALVHPHLEYYLFCNYSSVSCKCLQITLLSMLFIFDMSYHPVLYIQLSSLNAFRSNLLKFHNSIIFFGLSHPCLLLTATYCKITLYVYGPQGTTEGLTLQLVKALQASGPPQLPKKRKFSCSNWSEGSFCPYKAWKLNHVCFPWCEPSASAVSIHTLF